MVMTQIIIAFPSLLRSLICLTAASSPYVNFDLPFNGFGKIGARFGFGLKFKWWTGEGPIRVDLRGISLD